MALLSFGRGAWSGRSANEKTDREPPLQLSPHSRDRLPEVSFYIRHPMMVTFLISAVTVAASVCVTLIMVSSC